jgi:hypothetical protein
VIAFPHIDTVNFFTFQDQGPDQTNKGKGRLDVRFLFREPIFGDSEIEFRAILVPEGTTTTCSRTHIPFVRIKQLLEWGSIRQIFVERDLFTVEV